MTSPLYWENLSFRYFSQSPVLCEFSLQLNQGECLGLIGPSGQGKTTALKLAAGLLKPSSGKVWLSGEDWALCNGDSRKRLRRELGMIFQSTGLFDSMTAFENLNLVLKEHTKLTSGQRAEKIADALEEVGLSGSEEKIAHEMSGGMRKRLGIARALLLEPKLILCDEPTAGLDPITSRTIGNLLQSLRQRHGGTMVLVMSDVDQLFSLCDRVAVIYQGKIHALGTTEQIQSSKDRMVRQFVRGEVSGPLTEGDLLS